MELEGVRYSARSVAYVDEGDVFQLRVIVEDADRDTGEAAIEGLEQFQVHSSSRSTSIALNNNAFTSQTTHTYDLSAPQEGQYTLGPASVKQHSNVVRSLPVTLHVVPSSQEPARQQKDSGGDNRVQVTMTVDTPRVVEGEAALLNVEMQVYGQVHNMRIEPLSFAGFTTKEIEDVQQERGHDDEGKQYTILKKRYVLFATQPGEHKLTSVKVHYHAPKERRRLRRGALAFDDDFFSSFFGSEMEQKVSVSNSLSLHVDSLPHAQGRIDGVGLFTSFILSVDKYEALVNEPLTVRLKLVGTGNLDQITAPLLQLPSGTRFYESQVNTQQDLRTGFSVGSKEFSYIVQCSQPGTVQLPSQTFTFFDTELRAVRQLKTTPVTVQIKQPAGLAAPVVVSAQKEEKKREQQKPEIFSQDIHFIEQEAGSPGTQRSLPWWFFFFALLTSLLWFYREVALPMLQKIACFIGIRFYEQESAYKALGKKLGDAKTRGDCSLVYAAFLDYFAHCFRQPLTSVDLYLISEKLKSIAWSEDKVQEFIVFLDECAVFAFAPTRAKELDINRFLARAEYWAMVLEETFAKKNVRGKKK